MLLVDGDHLLHRCMHQPNLANLITSSGRRTGGVSGFVKSLRSTLDYFSCGRCIVIFGKGRSPRRLKLYPDYKLRPDLPKPEDVASIDEYNKLLKEIKAYYTSYLDQKKLLKYLLSKMSIRCYEYKYEADDVIGLLTFGVKERVIILSEDWDMATLVKGPISLYRPIADTYIDESNFYKKTKFLSSVHYLVYKAIEGDSSDNIQGVKGVSIGTLAPLLDDLAAVTPETLFNQVLAKCENNPTSRHKKVVAGKYQVKLNIKLIDISREAFLQEDLDDIYRMRDSRVNFDLFKITEVFEALECKKLLSILPGWIQTYQRLV